MIMHDKILTPLGSRMLTKAANIVTEVVEWQACLLQEGEMSAALQQDFDDFVLFCTKRHWQQQHEPIAPITAKQYVLHLRYRNVLWYIISELAKIP